MKLISTAQSPRFAQHFPVSRLPPQHLSILLSSCLLNAGCFSAGRPAFLLPSLLSLPSANECGLPLLTHLLYFILLWLVYCHNHTFRDRIKIRKLKAGRNQWKSPCSHVKYQFYVSCAKIQLTTARTKTGLASWHSDEDSSCQTSWLEITPQSPHAGKRKTTLQVVLWWCTAWQYIIYVQMKY